MDFPEELNDDDLDNRKILENCYKITKDNEAKLATKHKL